jgi:hypothetical protein
MNQVKKELLLRAVYSENGVDMRMDIKKTGLSPQEALGIMEMAKERMMDELKEKMIVSKKQVNDNGKTES